VYCPDSKPFNSFNDGPTQLLNMRLMQSKTTIPKLTKDLKTVVDQLVLDRVFDDTSDQLFRSYKKQPLLQTLNWTTINEWVKEKIIDLYL